MTDRRYTAYRRVRQDLDLLSSETLAEPERELLRDAAEGLLLARDDAAAELEELRSRVALALSLLVGLGRWSDAAADDMWARMMACAPASPTPVGRWAHAVPAVTSSAAD